MVKHTQTIRGLLMTNCLSVFDHFVGLALKGLKLLNANTENTTISLTIFNIIYTFASVISNKLSSISLLQFDEKKDLNLTQEHGML